PTGGLCARERRIASEALPNPHSPPVTAGFFVLGTGKTGETVSAIRRLGTVEAERAALLAHPLFARVGGTPLVPLRRVGTGLELFAKLESANPGGSVKDRAARGIVAAAIRAGELPEKRLL